MDLIFVEKGLVKKGTTKIVQDPLELIPNELIPRLPRHVYCVAPEGSESLELDENKIRLTPDKWIQVVLVYRDSSEACLAFSEIRQLGYNDFIDALSMLEKRLRAWLNRELPEGTKLVSTKYGVSRFSWDDPEFEFIIDHYTLKLETVKDISDLLEDEEFADWLLRNKREELSALLFPLVHRLSPDIANRYFKDGVLRTNLCHLWQKATEELASHSERMTLRDFTEFIEHIETGLRPVYGWIFFQKEKYEASK